LASVGRRTGSIGCAWRRWAVEEVQSVVLGVGGPCRALVFAALVQGQIVCALMERR